jgi:hypothetical protein
MIIACVASAIVTIVTFFLYIRARMAIRDQDPVHNEEEHAQKLARLDRREQRFQAIHFITLALFVLLGVLILVHLSNKLNQGTITNNRHGVIPAAIS